MTQEQKPMPERKQKRAWSPPRIVSTQAAFEHAILACTGAIGLTRPSRQPKGACTTGGIANS